MSEDSSKTESAYIQSKQANVLGRTSNPPIASFWHTVLGECMQWHKSLASSPALKGGASARQVLVMGLCEIDKVLREIRDTAQTIQSDAEGAASSLSAYNRRAGV